MAEALLWRLAFIVGKKVVLFTCSPGDEGSLTDKLMTANNDPKCPVKEREVGSLRGQLLRLLRFDGIAVVELGSVRDRIFVKDKAEKIVACALASVSAEEVALFPFITFDMPDVDFDDVSRQ